MASIDVSIIIVNYNTENLLRDCIKSIYDNTRDISFEIIVSDNGSKDNSVAMLRQNFPEVKIIENNSNLGFGVANNRGLKEASGKYIFYLNSDTLIENNAVKFFYDYWENSPEKDSIGALGCNLLDNFGNLTHSFGNFPSLKSSLLYLGDTFLRNIFKTILYVLRLKRKSRKHFPTPCEHYGEVDYITGADLFLKNNDAAVFNDAFFLYYEETFLEWNLSKKGLKRIIIEGPKIKHLTQGGVKRNFKDSFLSRSFVESFYSLAIYFMLRKKNFTAKICSLFIVLIYVNPLFFPKNLGIIGDFLKRIRKVSKNT